MEGRNAMSPTAKEINKITGVIIGVAGRLIVYALVIMLLYEGVTAGYAFGHDIFYAPAADPESETDMTVTIEEGTDVFQAASQLTDQGLIAGEASFVAQSLFFSYDVNPGTYTLSPSMTPREILQIMDENTKQEEEE